jgi:tetratricopeptide (TPR) repeat protein
MQRTLGIKLIFFLIFSGVLSISQAATIQSARDYYRAGKLELALVNTSALLKANPDSIPALFLKAQIESESQGLDEAIATYKKIIVLESGHLQAYNNLAALYAQQGKLKQASAILEQAIRSDPVFTTIHTNLRAIYVDMSQKHYRQALKLKPENNNTQIATIDIDNSVDQILSEEVQVMPESIQAAINTTVASVGKRAKNEIETKPPTTKKSTPFTQSVATIKVDEPVKKPTTQTTAIIAAKPKELSKEKPKQVAKVQPQPKPKSEPESFPKKDPGKEVINALLAWANAWSNRDTTNYVKAYLENYATPGKTNEAWAAGRRWNFKNKKYIKVTLSNIHIQPDGDQYSATFKQQYQSDTYKDVVNKKLRFVRQSGRWKIAKEVTS